MDIKVKSEIQAPPILDSSIYQRTVSIDPGVTTFGTLYDPSGYCYKWGHQDISRIYRLCHHYDRLQGQWSQPDIRHKKRHRLKRVGARLQLKIRNLVDDLHKKLVKFLCENYTRIIIPKFETQGMIRRSQRRINSATARKMVTWAHYRFRQRLIAKAREYPNCQVIVVNEAYTSKTCGRCGRINWNLGGKRMFRCSHCGLEIDRDLNGARNIMIKTLSN
jgi:putative transposase